MELHYFLDALVGRQDIIDEATRAIEQASQVPEFIFYLFDSIHSADAQSNPKLLEQILIRIAFLVRENWSNFNPESEKPPFWTTDQRNTIIQRLFSDIFSLNSHLREHIVSAFRKIILFSFPDVVDIVQTLLQALSDRGSSLSDVYTIIQILYPFCKGCNDRVTKVRDMDQLDSIDSLGYSVIVKYAELIALVGSSIKSSEDAQYIVYIIAKSVKRLTKLISCSLLTDSFVSLLTFFLDAMCCEGSSQTVIFMRRMVAKLFMSLCSSFLSQKEKQDEDPTRQKFADYFRSEVSPVLLRAISASFDLPSDFALSSLNLFLLYQFAFYKLCTESVITPELIVNVIIRKAILSAEEVNEAFINPEQFFDFNLDNEVVDMKTPRLCCANIIRTLVGIHGLVDELYTFLAPSGNEMPELEAKCYLLYIFVSTVLEDEHDQLRAENRKRRKEMGKNYEPIKKEIVPHISESDLKTYIDLLQKGVPHYFEATIILLLTAILPETDALLGFQIGSAFLANESPLVVTVASKLFVKCHELLENPPQVDAPSIITSIIETTTAMHHASLFDSLKICCEYDGADLSSSSPKLIDLLFQIARGYISGESENTVVSDAEGALDVIYNILDSFNDDDPHLVELAPEVFEAIFGIFDDFPQNSCANNLLLIASSFCMTLHNPIPAHYAAFWKLYNLLKKDNFLYVSMQEINWFLYPLLTNPKSEVRANPEMKAAFMELVSDSLQFLYDDRESYCYDIPHALFLSACAIEVLGSEAMFAAEYGIKSFGEMAKKASENEEFNTMELVCSTFCVLSALMCNEAEIIQKLGEDILDLIGNWCNKLFFTNYREAKACFVFLLLLSKVRPEFYSLACDIFKQMITYKEAEGKEEEEEKNDDEADTEKEECAAAEMEEEKEEIEKIAAPFEIPFDGFNEIELFNQISSANGQLESIEEETKSYIKHYLNNE